MYDLTLVCPFYNPGSLALEHFKKHKDLLKHNLQIIYVSDGSKDNTLKLLKKYKESLNNTFKKKILIFSLKKNNGPGIARNFAIKKIKSRYLIFLDIDDYLIKKNIKHLLNELKKNCKDVFILNYVKNGPTQVNLAKKKKIIKRNLIKDFLRTELDMNPNFYAFRKSFIDRYKIKFKKGYYEDINFMLKCFVCYQSLKIYKKEIYKKNINKRSITQTSSLKHITDFISVCFDKKLFFDKNIKNQIKSVSTDDLQYGLRGDYIFTLSLAKKSKLKNKKNIIGFIDKKFKKILDKNFKIKTSYDKIVKNNLF